MNDREFKGNSLIDFPMDYTVIDIETTGFDPYWCEIIEVGALKIRGDQIVDRFSTLIKPSSPIDSYIEELTGITQAELNNAPVIGEILSKFIEFIDQDILVGHNVNFDINFLYDAVLDYGELLKNDFVDTVRLMRKLHPELVNKKLTTCLQFYKVPMMSSHRSIVDCESCFELFKMIKNEILNHHDSFDDFKNTFKKVRHKLKASDIVSSVDVFDEDHPLFDKVCVFTGTLEKMTRAAAMKEVVDVGGVCGDKVTQKTNYLIMGNFDFTKNLKDGKSSKFKKAEKLKADGQEIEIISESMFYDLINKK